MKIQEAQWLNGELVWTSILFRHPQPEDFCLGWLRCKDPRGERPYRYRIVVFDRADEPLSGKETTAYRTGVQGHSWWPNRSEESG